MNTPAPRLCRALQQAAALVCLTSPLAAESLIPQTHLSDGNLYTDQVARAIGDLLTVRVVENMTIRESQSTSTSRDNDLEFNVNLLPYDNNIPSTVGQTSSVGRLPGLDIESAKAFDGSGDHSSSGQMTFALSGRVIDVLDNGNLVIEARRSIRVNDDTKTIVLSGICRRADIGSENSVLSTALHGFEVSVVGEGPLSRAQQEGWLAKLMDVLWPF